MAPCRSRTQRVPNMVRSMVLAAAALMMAGGADACEPLADEERRGGYSTRVVRLLRDLPTMTTPTIFLGDSLIAGWPDDQRARIFPDGSINFGAGGDQIEHVMWRIRRAIPEGASYKTATLLIGTNNLRTMVSNQILCGIEALVDELRRRSPGVQIYVLEIPPRGPGLAQFHARIAAVNRALPSRLEPKGATVVPIHAELLRRSAVEGPETFFRDGLHFTPAGYAVLTEALRRVVPIGAAPSPLARPVR